MKKPEINNVEVDMVPLIDIISLLLMFLIIVGDTQANTSSIKMKLPAASQAKPDDAIKGAANKGRIVIQMAKVKDKYQAVLNNIKYDVDDSGKTLKDHLDKVVDTAVKKGEVTRNADNTVDIPVKLRIPEDCPMAEVEKVLSTMASLGLVNVQYSASAEGHVKR
jgi:biopolymer transport protein ExbD